VIKGLKELNDNLIVFCKESIINLAEAIDNTDVKIQNEAKADHGGIGGVNVKERGWERAHLSDRYEDISTNLTNSIQAKEVEFSDMKIKGGVEAGEEYAVYIELGTSRSQPYPFLFPALENNVEYFKEQCREAMRKSKWVK
jgi:hypothetical protein